MKEIEVKVLDIDQEKVVSKLLELGAIKVFDGEYYSILFDHKKLGIKKNKQTLRLRTSGNHTFLTFKQKQKTEFAKIHDEFETDIKDFETMRTIMTKLGFYEFVRFKKHRVSYLLKDTKFEFDTPPNIPTYLEIEAPDQDTIKKYLKILDLDPTRAKPISQKDVVKHYEKKN